MNVVRFRAPWGTMLKSVSVVATLLLALIPWLPVPHPTASVTVFLQLVPLALIVGTVPFVVRGYTVTDDAILVHRLLWSTRLPREGLVSARAEPDLRKGTIKTCGNGGLYSFTGWFWNKRIGHFRAFVNDWPRAVVLRFSNRGAVVVSPDDPGGFIEALGAMA